MRPTDGQVGHVTRLQPVSTTARILAPADVLVGLRASRKARVLAEMSRHAAGAVGIAPDVILGALTRREDLGSTGMGGGIAIPHTRLADVAAPFGVLARLRSPVAFDAVDDAPVDLVFLLLLPPDGKTGIHLNALACVARRLRDPAVAKALRGARDGAELYAAFVSEGAA